MAETQENLLNVNVQYTTVGSKYKKETLLGYVKQVVENHLEEETLLKENPRAPKVPKVLRFSEREWGR